MLECLACDHQGVVEAAVGYFDMLSAVQIEQRDPQLRAPVYASMLPRLLDQAAYPQSFTSWELSTDLDSHTFHTFR